MDGTLTREGALDYTAMYSRAGAPEGCKNILEWIETLDAAQQDKANLAIREVEREGYARTQVNDKCIEMLQELKRAHGGLRLGILTRNSDEAVEVFLDSFKLRPLFDHTISRDWAGGKCKPSGDALVHFSKLWECTPAKMLMIGDWKDDMAAGKAAGAITVLKHLGEDAQRANFHLVDQADHVVHCLSEIPPLVERLARAS